MQFKLKHLLWTVTYLAVVSCVAAPLYRDTVGPHPPKGWWHAWNYPTPPWECLCRAYFAAFVATGVPLLGVTGGVVLWKEAYGDNWPAWPQS